MAGLGELIQSLMGIGGQTPDAVMANAVQPQGAPAGAPAPPPATPVAAPPATPTDGPAPQATGAPAIGGPATPPDLTALYTKLVNDNHRQHQLDMGLNTLAAGFASPGNRAALLQGAGVSGGPDPASQLQTILALRNDQIKQAQLATGRNQLQGIADRYKIPLPAVQQLFEAGKLPEFISQQEKNQVVSSDKGGISAVNPALGTVQKLQEGTGDENTVAQKKLDFAHDNWEKYNLPDPNNPANAAYWKDLTTKVLAPGGGQQINVGENAMDKFTAEKVYGPAVEAGKAALDANHTIASMKQLALTGNEDLPNGPAALLDLKTRQGLGSILGVTMEGVPEAEGIQKLNQALATASVKAISSRPTQMEFAKALENNPGILQSRAGMLMMMEILKQDNEAKAAIGGMALNKDNHGKDWLNLVDNYYKDHPLVSPFDSSRPFGKEDIEILSKPGATKVVDGNMYYNKGDKWFKADSAR